MKQWEGGEGQGDARVTAATELSVNSAFTYMCVDLKGLPCQAQLKVGGRCVPKPKIYFCDRTNC